MEIQELLRLAWKSLVVNKLRSILTTLGIIIGVFAIILLVSLGTGLQKYITGQISGLGSNLVFIIPGSTNGRTVGGAVSNKLTYQDARDLELRLRDSAYVAPVVIQTTNAKYKNKSGRSIAVTGTTSNYPQLVSVTISTGSFFTKGQEQSGARVAVIGQTVIKNLFSGDDPVGKAIIVGTDRYIVIGTLAKRGSVFGNDQDNVIIVPLTLAQRQFGITNVNVIYLSAKQSSQVPFVKSQATKILLRRLTENDFTVQTQESALSTVTNVTNVLSAALGGIAAISLLVGGIGVANIMLVSVTERTKEIGLRKALGARRSDILNQFLLEAIILSVAGGAIGILLGIGASLVVSTFFSSEVTPWSIFLAFFFSVAVGVIFGMAPAIKASKLSPIEALRYE
jgi:putative ABC transport system permease protein